MRTLNVLAFFLLLTNGFLLAQPEQWDVYMVQYEKGAGSTLVDLGLKASSPNSKLPFVLITGVGFKACNSEGMPTSEEFKSLYQVSDSVGAIVRKHTSNRLAGTFTYQCDRLDYYYVSDTVNLRSKLAKLYSTSYKNYKPYISIKPDPKWEYYLGFLYPNETTMEYMKNQKVVSRLYESGDKLDKPRQVDHWLYFSSVADRECFEKYALKNKFKIGSKEKLNSEPMPYKLHIIRVDRVDLSAISNLTLELEQAAKACKGDYDGWETFVIK